jgi:ABC-2 type transport system permease protein
MSPLLLTANREIRETVRHKTFWIVNAVLFVGALAAVIIPSLIHSGGGTDTVAIVSTPPDFEDALRQARSSADTEVRVFEVESAAAARRQVDDKHVDVAVVGGERPTIVVRSGQHDGLVAAAQTALASTQVEANLRGAGLSAGESRAALSVEPAHVDGLDSGADARRGAAAIAATLLYILLLTLTISVANGVAIEKANRISEVLLAIVPPRPLLFGKVLGVGLMGIATLLFGIIPVAARLLLGGDMPEGIGGALVAGAAWFTLGLAFYLVMSGSLAALVERQEQAGAAMGPLMAALIASLVVAQSAPEGSIATVLAYIPFSSPVVEPARIAVGTSSPTEMALSLAILLVSLAVAIRVGGVVYQRAIVRTGRRLKLSEVLRTA